MGVGCVCMCGCVGWVCGVGVECVCMCGCAGVGVGVSHYLFAVTEDNSGSETREFNHCGCGQSRSTFLPHAFLQQPAGPSTHGWCGAEMAVAHAVEGDGGGGVGLRVPTGAQSPVMVTPWPTTSPTWQSSVLTASDARTTSAERTPVAAQRRCSARLVASCPRWVGVRGVAEGGGGRNGVRSRR